MVKAHANRPIVRKRRGFLSNPLRVHGITGLQHRQIAHQFFRARLWANTEINGCSFPIGYLVANKFADLLASLRKTMAHEIFKNIIIAERELARIALRDTYDGRIHFRLRKEDARWNSSQKFDAIVELHEQCERAVVARGWRSAETFCQLLL